MAFGWIGVAGAIGAPAACETFSDGAGQDQTATCDVGQLGGDLADLGPVRCVEVHSGSFAPGIHHFGHDLLYTYSLMPVHRPRSVEGTIEGFSPTSVGGAAGAFARSVVAQAGPDSAARAKALLFAAAKLADFAVSVGVVATAEMLTNDALIERFILCGTQGVSLGTRRTLRTNLRSLARAVAPPLGPDATSLPRERAKPPYARGEIDAYLALAAAQPTRSRRMRAGGLIALGAGAGLIGADLRSVRGIPLPAESVDDAVCCASVDYLTRPVAVFRDVARDVIARSGGLVVVVGGKKPRVVPVLARYHDLLGESAAFAAEGYVVGANNPRRHNVTTPLISSLAGGVDLARLDAGRLRASWLWVCAEAIGLSSFMAAAGITCSQRLGDIAAGVPKRSEAQTVALLGGLAH